MTSLSDATVPSFAEASLAYQRGEHKRAYELVKPLATEGDAEAQVMLATLYLRGEGVDTNTDEAARLLRLAAAQKETDAYMALGRMALSSQAGFSPSDAMAWFSRASIAGRVDAKRAIGEMYIKGLGIAPSVEKGRSWLQQALDSGDQFAASLLAKTYFETDPNMALSLYERAASYGDADAAYVAAIMLAENLDVKPDSVKLADLLRQAAEADIPAAQADYGLLTYQGAGVERSIIEAAEWFEKSAKGGDSEGQFLYAFTLAKGEGVTQSYEDAYYWLLRSENSQVEVLQADIYLKDRQALKTRLEENIDPALLEKARNRFKQDQSSFPKSPVTDLPRGL